MPYKAPTLKHKAHKSWFCEHNNYEHRSYKGANYKPKDCKLSLDLEFAS